MGCSWHREVGSDKHKDGASVVCSPANARTMLSPRRPHRAPRQGRPGPGGQEARAEAELPPSKAGQDRDHGPGLAEALVSHVTWWLSQVPGAEADDIHCHNLAALLRALGGPQMGYYQATDMCFVHLVPFCPDLSPWAQSREAPLARPIPQTRQAWGDCLSQLCWTDAWTLLMVHVKGP